MRKQELLRKIKKLRKDKADYNDAIGTAYMSGWNEALEELKKELRKC